MRKLKIELYDENNNHIKTIIARHLDATKHMTIISISETSYLKESEVIRLDEKIDYFNIFEGLITIYYQNGFFLEISRV